MHEITRRAFMATLGAGALALAGCGSNEQDIGSAGQQSSGESKPSLTPSEPQDLQITESGWSVDDNGYINYAVAIKNPNSTKATAFATVTATGKAEDGSVVFSDESFIKIVFPGETVYHGMMAGNGVAPATMEFAVSQPEWEDSKPLEGDIYSISNTAEVDNGYGLISYTGEIASAFDPDKGSESDMSLISSTTVVVVLRDESGSIVYGQPTYIDTPMKGETTPFEIPCYGVPAHASYEIHAHVG